MVSFEFMETPLYRNLNLAFKTTSKILFGEELGELSEYEKWLKKSSDYAVSGGMPFNKIYKNKGNPAYVFSPYYREDANFIDYSKLSSFKPEPLTIDEIKDIDSIREALRDKFYFVSSVILGKSEYVEKADSVIDSYFVYDSYAIESSSYVAYSNWIRQNAKYVFASLGGPDFKYVIKCAYGAHLNRAFEVYTFVNVSDAYYGHQLDNCREIMFSFNQRGKSYMIGNLSLGRDKYYALKKKLLNELREELLSNKELPSLIELVNESNLPDFPKSSPRGKEEFQDFDAIDNSFKQTTKIVLKKDYALKDLETFLASTIKTLEGKPVETVFGNKTDYYEFIFHTYADPKRTISLSEESLAEALHLSEEEISSFKEIKSHIGKIGLFRHELRGGKCFNNIKTPVSFGGVNTYRTYDVTDGKYQALNYIGSPNSDYIYGSFFVVNSSFVILSTASANIRRAFQADKCNNSSDIYFTHDVEGGIEVMFSQHIRNKSYIIGNLELDKTKYIEIKNKLLEEINNELSSKGKLSFSIWNF